MRVGQSGRQYGSVDTDTCAEQGGHWLWILEGQRYIPALKRGLPGRPAFVLKGHFSPGIPKVIS
jgi:hypothetical protein